MHLLREITTSSNFGNVYLQARLQLVVNVTNNAVELVDRVVVDIPRDTRVNMIPPTATAYIGELMNVNITLSFGIRNNCPMDTYGSGCSVLCQPQDNELGVMVGSIDGSGSGIYPSSRHWKVAEPLSSVVR